MTKVIIQKRAKHIGGGYRCLPPAADAKFLVTPTLQDMLTKLKELDVIHYNLLAVNGRIYGGYREPYRVAEYFKIG